MPLTKNLLPMNVIIMLHAADRQGWIEKSARKASTLGLGLIRASRNNLISLNYTSSLLYTVKLLAFHRSTRDPSSFEFYTIGTRTQYSNTIQELQQQQQPWCWNNIRISIWTKRNRTESPASFQVSIHCIESFNEPVERTLLLSHFRCSELFTNRDDDDVGNDNNNNK